MNIYLPWAKLLEDETKGKVKVTVYPAQALCTLPDTVDAVKAGITDIAAAMPGVPPGRFPLTEMIGLPATPWCVSSEVMSQLQQRLYDEGYIAKEWADVKVLFFYTTPPSAIPSTAPIRSFNDIKGMKLGTVAGAVGMKILKELGFVPSTVSTPEIYLALQKKVIDATTLTWESIESRKINEVAPYVFDCNIYCGHFVMLMNLNKFKALPPDVQKVIEDISGMSFAGHAGRAFDAMDLTAKHRLEPKLKDITKLSPVEEERWYKIAESVWNEWIAEMEAKGLPAQKVFDAALRITKELK
jgi:TRAP-type C4-dicarboxylate transport system substrate-binding protein